MSDLRNIAEYGERHLGWEGVESVPDTDHLTAAQACISTLPGDIRDEDHQDRLLRKAQVHATIALAEQQRTANLIALLSAENGDFFFMTPEKASRPEMYGDVAGRLLAEVQNSIGGFNDVPEQEAWS